MSVMSAPRTGSDLLLAAEIERARIDLAAAFRWFARLGMHEAVANHLSVAVSADGSRFLMNPRGRHFSRVRASDLLLLDANDRATLTRPNAPDPTAWYIHGRLHALLPQARCVMHLHPKFATALDGLADSTMTLALARPLLSGARPAAPPSPDNPRSSSTADTARSASAPCPTSLRPAPLKNCTSPTENGGKL